jgi:internalin A
VDVLPVKSHCPSVFVLRPRHTKDWLPLILDQKIDLKLYCQAPGIWHPTQDGGLYEIDEPAVFLDEMASYIKKMVSELKHIEPVIGPWVRVREQEYKKRIERDIKLMGELVERLPDIVVTEGEMNIESQRRAHWRLYVGF